MLISHSNKFIFIHNYKVAGTSIKDALLPYSSVSKEKSSLSQKLRHLLGNYPKIYSADFPAHINTKELREQLPNTTFQDYYKFGFVRDPWDWQVSLYTYMLKSQKHPQHKFIKKMNSFEEYINWRVNDEVRLQKNVFYDGDECLVDFVGKMETLNSDFSKICNRVEVDASLPHLNRSRSEVSHLKYYNQKTVDLVYEAFLDDIQTFGYKKPVLQH
ncbi:MAG: sulfotransferase family 2 domain-containing protein [Bacteroidota bacterium]